MSHNPSHATGVPECAGHSGITHNAKLSVQRKYSCSTGVNNDVRGSHRISQSPHSAAEQQGGCKHRLLSVCMRDQECKALEIQRSELVRYGIFGCVHSFTSLGWYRTNDRVVSTDGMYK